MTLGSSIKTNGTGLQYLLMMTVVYILVWRTFFYGFNGNKIRPTMFSKITDDTSVSSFGFWLHKYIMMTPWSLHVGGLIMVIIYGSINYQNLKNKQFIFLLTLFISCGLFGEAMNTVILKEIISSVNGWSYTFKKELWTRQFDGGKSRGNPSTTLGCSTHVKPEYTNSESAERKTWKKGLPSGHSQIWGLVATMITLYTLGNETQPWIQYITIPFVLLLALLVMEQRNYISCHKFIQITSGCTFGIFYGILFYIVANHIAEDYVRVAPSNNITIPTPINYVKIAVNKVTPTPWIRSIIYGCMFLAITISLYICLILADIKCAKKTCNGIWPALIFLFFVSILVGIIALIVYFVNVIVPLLSGPWDILT